MNISKNKFTLIFSFFSFLGIFSSLAQTIFVPNSNKETAIDSNRLTIYWKTLLPGDTKVDYGETDSYELGSISTSILSIEHSITIPNLRAATVYHLNCRSKNSSGESAISNWLVSTASQYSSGFINVYFNHSINAKIAAGETARSNVDFSKVLILRIDSSKYSVDVCVYSFSGTITQSSPYGIGSDIADALIRAKNRNVKIRFIIEYDNQNTSPVNKIKSASIPVITDKFGNNDGSSLQHNKFFIFDARDSFTDKEAWIITGSWNATNPGTYNDYQNIIEIQDKSLAQAYTLEFNEMWGSLGDQPDQNKSKFAKNKTDNTPHRFNIKGTPVELYFAPTDGVSYQTQVKINNSLSSVIFSEMTFTSNDIARSIQIRNNAKNIKVRGVLNNDNLNDQGSEYDFLNTIPNSIVKAFDAQGAIFHHKYLVIDGDRPDLAPWVLTGSYNLTATAESSNNENLLFIQSSRIANLYLQEFTQRYFEAGGKDTLTILKVENQYPKGFQLLQNYPNPFNSSTVIPFSLNKSSFISLKIFDLFGREVQSIFCGNQLPGDYKFSWSPKNIPTGIYFYRLVIGALNKLPNSDFSMTKRMIYLK